MDYLWSSLSSATSQPQHSGADTVDKLCDRVARSTLLEDRRDAVRALKALAREYQLEVGTQGMDILMQVLQNDRSDQEIVRYALEGLSLIFHSETADDAEANVSREGDIGVGFTEIFVKHTEYVSLLLSLLDDHDFQVRFQVIEVLSLLLANMPAKLQECVLNDPRGVSRLMDLLDDQRVLIRNEALLLLIQLTGSNPAIQKLVVFENAFDRVVGIILSEGMSDGGIIVQDCLHLLHSLLRKNLSNQNYFRETMCMKQLAPLLSNAPPILSKPRLHSSDEELGGPQADDSATTWSSQKTANMLMMIELVRILVTPGSPNTPINQMALHTQGVLKALLTMTLSNSTLPAAVRVPLRLATAEAINGNMENQNTFMGMTECDSGKPRPVVVALVADLLAYREPFNFRYASLYCLECLLQKNSEAQQFMAQTLHQPFALNLEQAMDTPLAVGAQLIAAINDAEDGITHWLACLALSHIIRGNTKAKQIFLATQVQTESGPVPLMHKLVNAFSCDGMQQARVWCGEFVLLCTLCMKCPTAISTFLAMPPNIPFLIQQSQHDGQGPHALTPGLAALLLGICMQWTDNENVQTNKNALLHVIHRVITTETYMDALDSLIGQDAFSRAQQFHELVTANPDENWLDFPFTVLAKKAREEIKRTEAQVVSASSSPLVTPVKGVVDHTAVLAQYQGIVHNQEEELTKLREQLASIQVSCTPPPVDTATLDEADNIRQEIQGIQLELNDLEGQFKILQAEQDDLLVLLAEQDSGKK
eukprot:Ihof_evm11s12 gene=Ihof_evmTU11s12